MSKRSFACLGFASVAAISASSLAFGSSEKVLYSFPAGSNVYGQVQEDSVGNLYGTTQSEDGHGTVYQLRAHDGAWRARSIHVFGTDEDGAAPNAGLTPDRTVGAFYGSTTGGGFHGRGTIFSLVRSNRQWKENVLHHFDGSDGAYPAALVTRDKATGNLYGTTTQGGAYRCGTVFQLNPSTVQLGVLYNFQGGSDGCSPETQMRPGPKAGTLFGSTIIGGSNNVGTLFLLKQKGGNWSESVLHTFNGGDDGATPFDITEPADDAAASIYGVALNAGRHRHGVVFRLSKPDRKWLYSVIYAFTGGSDGAGPVGLRLDRKTGQLYGTTAVGGASGQGVLFKLQNTDRDHWSETVLHAFTGGSADGAYPESRPILDPQTGILYGTTLDGGAHDGGTVYAVTP